MNQWIDRPRMAWCILAILMLAAAAALCLIVVNWSTPVEFFARFMLLFIVVMVAFAAVGTIVSSRRPENPIGWLFTAIAAIVATSVLMDEIAIYTLATRPGVYPGGEFAAWLSSTVGGILFVAPLALIFLVFPNGRLASRRWRPVVWAIAVGAVLTVVGEAFHTGPLNASIELENPYGVDILAPLAAVATGISALLLIGSLFAGAVGLVRRLRSSRGVEREQLKWFAFADAILIVTLVLAPIVWLFSRLAYEVWPIVFAATLAFVPIAAAIAILRYRLFDIDHIINRTLVYGSLVALLGAGYVAVVFVLQIVFASVAAGSDLAIAVSTLGFAAACRPVRGHIQQIVDRHFYRAKYDAERTFAEFRARMRDEIDLDTVLVELRGVVNDTMQPRFVAL